MSSKVTKIGNSGSVKLNVTNLKSLIKNINSQYVVRVGILGSQAEETHPRKQAGALAKGGGHKTSKHDSPVTNAQIGLAHEKGVKSQNLPRRSWLEVPLQDHLNEYFKKLGPEVIADMLVNQPKKAFQHLGFVCEQIILKGFESNGFGKWAPLKSQTIANKGSDRILVDTAQLKKSITSEVVSK